MGWIEDAFAAMTARSAGTVVEREDALAGRDEPIPVAGANLVTGNPMEPPFPEGMESIVVGMGCFWGAEKRMWQLPGVWTTEVGYAGGWTPNPTYEEVCSGRTGHTEAVRVVFDPAELPVEMLLKTFYEAHDPTQGMRQGNDTGTQYRSAVYASTPEQLEVARRLGRNYEGVLAERGIGPVTTELALLDDAEGVALVLSRLDAAGVLTTYAGGLEPVYSIEPGQHLVAAFYRNSGIHWFVNRAILELAILHAHLGGYTDGTAAGWAESKRLRDLLKFEFFFPERDTYEAELLAELKLIMPDWEGTVPTAAEALTRLVDTGFFMAHRTLRSFFDAQLVVAERLAARSPDAPLEQKQFLDECVAVGQQMLLQARLHGPESVSSELFSSALALADNRGLLRPADETLQADREEFADRLRTLGEGLALAESLDVSNRKVQP